MPSKTEKDKKKKVFGKSKRGLIPRVGQGGVRENAWSG